MKTFVLHSLFSLYRWIFARRVFAKWNRLLFQLSLRGLGILNYGDRISGEARFIKRLATKSRSLVVLDVGANEGQYASEIKQLAPSALIYAFEPHPRTYERLAIRARDRNFQAINTACGKAPARMALYDYQDHPEGSQHASLYEGVIEQLHHGSAQHWEVEVITIDQFMSDKGVSHVDLLKIDTEGHEYEVLLGAQGAIERGAIDVIHVEFNEMNVISHVFCRDFYRLLHDYDFYRMLPNDLLPLGPYAALNCELFAYQNLVAIRRGSGGTNV